VTGILAFVEQRDGALKRVSLETLTAARAIADLMQGSLTALVIGPPGVDTSSLGTYGADRVVVVADERLRLYQPGAYTAATAARVREEGPAAAVLSATALGKDLGPRLAARLGCALASDVTALAFEQGQITVTRPVYAGKALLRLRVTGRPSVITIRPNSVTPVERPRAAAVEQGSAMPAEGSVRTVAVKEPPGAKLDVAEASIIVSGGRGLKEPANFALIEELAAAIGGAAVGASRAVVDAGWRPHADQVGQTGKTVSPNLYIAVGISGAIQHVAGMRNAKVIVAINKDKDAPIFKIADYGIVGDLFEIVPRLTQEIKKLRAG
jgi:electron transfer flavoprotein alpha subunit